MNLGKVQIEHIAREIRAQLYAIGDAEIEALRVAAREKFFKSKEGKMVTHLRTKYGKEGRCGNTCGDVVSSIEEQATKSITKPFSYISELDLSKRIAILSMDAATGQDLIEAVKREWYAKVKPAVRKQFNLK